jgi:predicted metal-dependent hydrolase
MKSLLDYPGLGYPCELKQHNGKNVSLSVYPNNRIVVRYPKRITTKFIIEFLHERKTWVRDQYEKNKKNNPKKTIFAEGEIIPIFGTDKKMIHSLSQPSLINEKNFILNIKGLKTEKGRILRANKFLRGELEKRAIPILQKYALRIKTKDYQLRIKTMRSLWGSCSPKNVITMNLALIFCPDFVFRYVIIHEMSHTVERNHSNRFWNLLESLDPDYELAEKWIKSNGKKILCYLF